MRKALTLILILALLSGLLLTGCSVVKAEIARDKLELAKKFVLEQKYEEAVLAYNEMIKIDPKMEEAYIGLANVYMIQNKTEMAENILKQGINNVDSKNVLRLSLAGILSEQGRYEEAQQEYNNMLLETMSKDSTSKDYSLLAKAYLKQGNTTKALGMIIESLKRDINEHTAYEAIEDLYDEDYKKIMDKAEEMLKNDSNDKIGLMLKFYALFNMGKYEEAAAMYNEIKEKINSDKTTILTSLAYYRLGKKQDAERLMSGLDIDKIDDVNILLDLVAYFQETGNTEKAIQLAEKGLEIDNKEMDLYLALYELTNDEKYLAQFKTGNLMSSLRYIWNIEQLNQNRMDEIAGWAEPGSQYTFDSQHLLRFDPLDRIIFKKINRMLFDELHNQYIEAFTNYIKEKVANREYPSFALLLPDALEFDLLTTEDMVKLFNSLDSNDASQILADMTEFLYGMETSNYNLNIDTYNLIHKYPLLTAEQIEFQSELSKALVIKEIQEIRRILLNCRNELLSRIINVKISQIDVSHYPAVKLYVSVYRGDKKPIGELGSRNFEILDNNYRITNFNIVPQNSKLANRKTNIYLVFDTSGSMDGAPLVGAINAGKQFINMMRQEDQLAIAAFNESVFPVLDFTNDKDKLLESISSLTPGGGTAAYDGVKYACQQLAFTTGRKVIVLLSDGRDNRSSSTLNEVIEAAKNSETSIFVVALGDFDNETLLHLANETGGQIFKTPQPEELVELYNDISNLVKQEYKIDYLANPDGLPTHDLKVKVLLNHGSNMDQKSYQLKKKNEKSEPDLANIN
ncbi:MAG: hypothetical protein PWQ59_680 [Thermoanaerobacterium sp.]|nr:hypothetical protein [Thermoanaerobacterium sp.]